MKAGAGGRGHQLGCGGIPRSPPVVAVACATPGKARWDGSESASSGSSWVPASRSFPSSRPHLDLGVGGEAAWGRRGGCGAAGSWERLVLELGPRCLVPESVHLESGETAGPPQTQTGALCLFLVWQVDPGWNFFPFPKKKKKNVSPLC